MREILFRGKRMEIGDFVEGSLIVYPDGDCYIARPSDDANVLDKFCVDPATVGQYTGLKDKRGKRIFEGDCLGHRLNTVEYGDGGFNVAGDVPLWMMAKNYEVIGNVHDNPELIGGAEDG